MCVLAVVCALRCGDGRSPSTPTPSTSPPAQPLATPPAAASCPFGNGSAKTECSRRTPTELLSAIDKAIDLLVQRPTGILDLTDGRLPEGSGELARMLAADVDALAFMRVPQFPSSRAFGDAPAVSTKEYQARVPKDPALVQVVPVPPRPLLEALRDPDLIARRTYPSDYAAAVWGTLAIAGVAALIWRAIAV